MYKFRLHPLFAGVLFLFTLTQTDSVPGAESAMDLNKHSLSVAEKITDQETNSKILVEIFLSQSHKKNIDEITNEFKTFSITKIRPQFFQLGSPPENIAIGKNIPADVAQLAIRIATTYNSGVKFIIAEKRLAPHYLAIGTSMLDEKFQIPITPDNLKKLADPALNTPQFHALYRLLTGEEKQP